MYHTILNNILRGFYVKSEKVFVFFTNLFTKEKKYVTLFPTRKGDEFLGMFYGYKKIRNNPFCSDYTSICNFSKKKSKLTINLILLNLGSKKGVCFAICIPLRIYLQSASLLVIENYISKF